MRPSRTPESITAMPRHPFHDVALVGAYHTRQAKRLATRELDVVLDAVRGALAAAHLCPPTSTA